MGGRVIKHMDCFAGAGGICTGFQAAGIKTVLAIEKVESCVETYRQNHPKVPVIHKDICKVTEKEIRQFMKSDIDVVTAGMPCETFSTAGPRSRSFYDARQFLFAEAIRMAEIVNAKLILFENVPGITTKMTEKNGNKLIIKEIFDQLSASGYEYYIDTVLDAADFGVPQHRERFFVLASRRKFNLRAPVARHSNFISVKEAFVDLPRVEANTPDSKKAFLRTVNEYTELLKDKSFWKTDLESANGHLTYHIPPKHRPGTLERFRLINQGEGLKDLFDKLSEEEISKLQENRILPHKWYIQRNRRLIASQPSVTVTSHCLDELIHPTLNRSLTVREVARLQSFPDWYDFKGGPLICPHMYETQDKYEQIGDAVPPLLAHAWGKVITNILEKI